MPEKDGYEVIRFVELGGNCYASTDYVKGSTLYKWIKENSEIDKNMLQIWFKEILKQLSLFHRQQNNPDYQFLNPYNVIITKKNKILLASIDEARKNTDQFVEKYFVPPSKMQNRDVYCFGKIIQFIMAHIQCEPYLSKKEEYKLLRVVRKCLEESQRNQYKNIQEIQDYFIKPKKRKYEISQNYTVKKKLILAGIIILLIMFCLMGIRRKKNLKLLKYRKMR